MLRFEAVVEIEPPEHYTPDDRIFKNSARHRIAITDDDAGKINVTEMSFVSIVMRIVSSEKVTADR